MLPGTPQLRTQSGFCTLYHALIVNNYPNKPSATIKVVPNKIDIYNEQDQPLGKQSTIDTALHQGLWHRGVHVVFCSNDGMVVVQKRSRAMRMHPGQLDISCGGFVDTGETPEQAAVRETKEELGITISPSQLHFMSVYRLNHVWPKIGIHDRAFIYCYMVTLPISPAALVTQPEEVEWAKLITLARAQRLVRLHRLRRLGRIEPRYVFYRYLLAQVRRMSKNAVV
ncbi:hypothetical protein BH09PAT4_BH09PAT4_01830 [soil metagenome]